MSSGGFESGNGIQGTTWFADRLFQMLEVSPTRAGGEIISWQETADEELTLERRVNGDHFLEAVYGDNPASVIRLRFSKNDDEVQLLWGDVTESMPTASAQQRFIWVALMRGYVSAEVGADPIP